MLCGVWEREKLSSLWDLNCLLYAEAQVVTARAKGGPGQDVPDDSADECEHQSEDTEEDPWWAGQAGLLKVKSLQV